MASGKSKAAIEFLHFLADISDPATGTISRIKLAAWLGMTERELRQRWIRRGARVAWQTFADELLAVLDAAQAQGHGLEQVIDWYLHTPIGQAKQRTADQLVIAGEARWLTRQLEIFQLGIAMLPRTCDPLSHW
ncbi:hypothetical protein [Dyella caseinilytica]|uniref:Uncharacterized protein n=1 Tax=Dyella caseinilytica TaxID=1849581 RepID=A0ABX7GUZ7_9GAMM|nr:hypothetical protein [Dyella caseinilytica]QRN53836.1 hypothetical protein ISN74_20990 [Dyella caseinilytica]GFZ89530.1 hypothetical protein GCM10011408_05610 [Dyella caseinilytica]